MFLDNQGERTQKLKNVSKSLKKIADISIKLRVFSDRLFVSSHRGWGGPLVVEGEGGGQQQRWGVNSGGEVSSTSKNRLTLGELLSNRRAVGFVSS